MKDIICPVSSIDFIPHSGTTVVNSSTLFTLSASDGGGCGVSSIKYRINYDTWIDYSSPFTLSSLSAGNHQIEFYSVDDLNNTEDIQNIYIQLIDFGTIPEISGYNLLLLISLVGIISLLILRKRIKSNSFFNEERIGRELVYYKKVLVYLIKVFFKFRFALVFS